MLHLILYIFNASNEYYWTFEVNVLPGDFKNIAISLEISSLLKN